MPSRVDYDLRNRRIDEKESKIEEILLTGSNGDNDDDAMEHKDNDIVIIKLEACIIDSFVDGEGDGAVIVAVIDSGIDYTHPDLVDNIWINKDEIPGSDNIDNDANGFIDDIYGWNFVHNTNNIMDDNGHGTHIGGIIGAKGSNNIGATGIAWDVAIMPLKFLNADGIGRVSDAMRALDYAIQMGATISQNSWTCHKCDDTTTTNYNAIKMAIQKAGNAHGSINFYATPVDIKNAIMNSVDTDPNLEMKCLSSGILNAYRALNTVIHNNNKNKKKKNDHLHKSKTSSSVINIIISTTTTMNDDYICGDAFCNKYVGSVMTVSDE
ncbi:subtilisin, putative [Perkinsus marinus ATCC 50983]|uniref:subtilisin n=1 Tax=Perkinsus marinus (strain ATCC 50983 / TXsc) TaxID=423536 RepID=C5LGB5_PERM5|nr:subtilisin, putative [Perkinsus marinus ATCC 50983]EER04229.1 subtilisin, putative [Perkinsus marinus ATCC 50983]|eukprot:XP_002772413.1 subtilisin, putative [Perkinsus marinus ATCC 50983]